MPSGPWIIRRPITHTPLVLADSRAAAFDVASREAIDRELELMVECDGTPIARVSPTGRVSCPDCGGSGYRAYPGDYCVTCAGSGEPREDEIYD